MIGDTINEIYSKNEFRFYSHQHELHFRGALKIFLDNKVFGIGPKLFRYHCSNDKYFIKEKINFEDERYLTSCSTSPHNLFIQALSETGIVGSIPIFFLIVILYYNFFKILLFKSKSDKFYLIFIYLSCIITLSPFTPMGNIFSSYISTMIYFNISIAYYLTYNEPTKN